MRKTQTKQQKINKRLKNSQIVNEIGCIKYNGYYEDNKLIIRSQGKKFYFCRLLLEEKYGPMPNKFTHHTCENTWCINIDHLEWVEKPVIYNPGRQIKITHEIAKEIYINRQYKTNYFVKKYGLSEGAVNAIKRNNYRFDLSKYKNERTWPIPYEFTVRRLKKHPKKKKKTQTKSTYDRGYDLVHRRKRAALISAQPFCSFCGSTEKLEAHHVTPLEHQRRQRNPELIILCRLCHIRAHGKKKQPRSKSTYWKYKKKR